MIDEKCVIYLKGKGFCWCPSDAWGFSDYEVCKLCQIKNSQVVEKIGPISPEKQKVLAAKSNRNSF